MTRQTLLHYTADDNRQYLIQNDSFDTTYIINVSEYYVNELPDWQDPMYDLTLLLALNPIKKINYIDKNFDIDSSFLDYAIEDYLDPTGDEKQIENFLNSLEKITAANNAGMIKEYLHSQGR
jgi:hypothetical protein